jgi:hypothetical protein
VVWTGDGGSDVGWRRSAFPIHRRDARGGLLRTGGQQSPIPRGAIEGVDAWRFGEIIRTG